MNSDHRNRGNRVSHLVALVLLISVFFIENQVDAGALPLDTITLPPGFTITVYADNVPNARGMALGQNGTLFVGSKEKGNVYAVVDKDGDQRADEVFTIAEGLNMPVGVAYRNGSLFVSAVDRILRFDKIEQRLTNPPAPATIKNVFPNETHHGWKFIAFGPDGKLYVPVGAPCNSCEPDPDRYALIARVDQDGSGYEVVARGVRNSVGFDWDPTTHDLWFTDNGRDYLGDNQPPDELNHASKSGLHFGYPYCHGGTISDPEYGNKHACREFTAPVVTLGPHVASLGMRFYTGAMFPQSTGDKSLLPSMAPGIGVKKSGIESRLCPEMSKEGFDTQSLQKDGSRAKRHGDAPLMFSSCRMARCWYRTIRQERFIESAIKSTRAYGDYFDASP